MAIVLRWAVFFLSVAITSLAARLFADFASADGTSTLDMLRLVLSSICVFWLAWGAGWGMLGLFVRQRPERGPRRRVSLRSRTAILVPVYNEDPRATFARVAAISAGLSGLGVHDRFSLFVLSDTTSEEVAAREAIWFDRLLGEGDAAHHIFYRRRPLNLGRKAGNIEDFIRQSGGAYEHAIVLDADSLIEPFSIVAMVERMEAAPRLGLLQTLPTIIHARSVFGRVMQFAAAYYSPVYARGTVLLQGAEGPYWGHNAIFRVTAFAQSCGLPELAGKPPFGGQILSHDYVEAALLARAGWQVRLDSDIGGSFEEGPENVLDYAKRDRRWCQGNLQHLRLLFAPKLKFWNRATLLQGIVAYLLSPLWLVLLPVSIAAVGMPSESLDSAGDQRAGWSLVGLVATLLILPKLLIMLRGMVDRRNRAFGGNLRVLSSVLAEIVFTSLIAPTILLLQVRAVLQILVGFDGGWPASNRADGRLTLRQAWAASHWITLTGVAGLAAVILFAPPLIGWSLAVLAPMMGAPLVIAFSSWPLRVSGWLWRIPEERHPSPIMEDWRRIHARWGDPEVISPAALSMQAKETADVAV
jgi:membrane glycosyltransferase